MIKTIGIKRAISLAALLAVNLVIVGAFFFWIAPLQENTELQRVVTINDIAGLQGRIQDVKKDMAYVREILPRYDEIKSRGFFQEQDRFAIGRYLNDIREGAGLAGFSFTIDSLQEIESPEAAKAGLRLVDSRIKITEIQSLTDAQVYKFIGAMQQKFPEHLRLQSLTFRKNADVNNDILGRIARKDPVSLLSGEVVFDWLTLVPQPAASQDNADAARPGAL